MDTYDHVITELNIHLNSNDQNNITLEAFETWRENSPLHDCMGNDELDELLMDLEYAAEENKPHDIIALIKDARQKAWEEHLELQNWLNEDIDDEEYFETYGC